MTRKSQAAIIFCLVAVIYAVILFVLPKQVFWITDAGNKFIQAENFARGNGLAIEYPARKIDPYQKFFPDSFFHFVRTGDHYVSYFPAYFPFLAAWLFRFIGVFGLYLPALIGGLLCVFFTRTVARELKLPNLWGWTFLVAAFATPIWFYSLVFWEQLPAAALALCGLILLLKALRRENNWFLLYWGGMLIGLSTFLREEGYVLLAAAGIGLVLSLKNRKRVAVFAMGGGIVLVGLWLANWYFYGHFLGIHAARYHALDSASSIDMKILGIIRNFRVFLFEFNTFGLRNICWAILLVLPNIVAILPGVLSRRWCSLKYTKLVIMFCSAISGGILSIGLWLNPEPVFNTLFTRGLFSSTPFLIFILLNFNVLISARKRRVRFIMIFSVAFIVITCLLLNRRDPAVCWGPRNYLALYPLLIPLCAYAFFRMTRKADFMVNLLVSTFLAWLLLVSFSNQLEGIRTLAVKKSASKQILAKVSAAKPDVIVSDIFWLPEEMASMFYKYRIMQVKSDKELFQVLQMLSDDGVKKFTMILSPRKQFRTISTPFLKEISSSVFDLFNGTMVIFMPEGCKFLGVLIISCKVPSRETLQEISKSARLSSR